MGRVYIPSGYRKYSGNHSWFTVSGDTVGAILQEVAMTYPEMKPALLDENGRLRRFLNIYVGDIDIRELQGLETAVSPDQEVMIIPAMAGGSGEIFSEEELQRYSRNILLQEIGVQGQRMLNQAKVLLVGAGGLGSPAALYLAAAGVGTIGVVDGDQVDVSNLQRQVLHATEDIGRSKVESARHHLGQLNPHVRVEAHNTVMTSANALRLIAAYDVVLNGCDNFPTRYLVNDACVMLQKPLVDASILMWEAQATVFMPGRGCYRCLYPFPPPPGEVRSCSDSGVIGAIAGHIGTWQALQVIEIILGIEDIMADRLLLFDALTGTYRTLRRSKDAGCPVCGDDPTIIDLIDYHSFCGVPDKTGESYELQFEPIQSDEGLRRDFDRIDLRSSEVFHLLGAPDVQWVDVREDHEYAAGHIPGSLHLPLSQINERYREIDPERLAIFVCAAAQRSGGVTRSLRLAGFNRAYNLAGGMRDWVNHNFPVVFSNSDTIGHAEARLVL